MCIRICRKNASTPREKACANRLLCEDPFILSGFSSGNSVSVTIKAASAYGQARILQEKSRITPKRRGANLPLSDLTNPKHNPENRKGLR